MHFSIPDTQSIRDNSGSYVAYNIHINGSFHCSLRYRQLYQFHLQMKKAFGADSLYNFPPKKFFPLSSTQLEERRSQIEKYIQIASQDSQIVTSDIFNGFLLAAQQETHIGVKKKDNCLEIYQLNWQCVKLSVDTSENSQVVLRKYAQAINLDDNLLPFFCLYLVQRVDNDFKTIRRLQNFESPFLTLFTENTRSAQTGATHLILVRKSYWDSAYDEELYQDKATLNIIYWQALHEVEKGYVLADKETRNRLTTLQAMGNKVEYLKTAQSLKFYSYIHFEPCYCDHPVPKSCVKISAGNQELNVRLLNLNEEFTFRVIRIKCWRLTTSNNPPAADETADSSSTSNQIGPKSRFELSFEYLVSKGALKWITIHSNQAVLISTCLQNMVEEMLVKREGKRFRSEGLSLHYNTSPNYSSVATIGLSPSAKTNENRDWNSSRKDGSSTNSSALREQQNDTPKPKQENTSKSNSTEECKQIEFNSTDMSQVKKVKYSRLVENNVFDEIGDDDL